MSINRSSFEDDFIVPDDASLSEIQERLIERGGYEPLGPGWHDLTPDTWREVFHVMLNVAEDEDRATLIGSPQCDGVGIPWFSKEIPDQENLTAFIRHPNPYEGLLLCAVFHMPDEAL
jgi:hypothetical protein